MTGAPHRGWAGWVEQQSARWADRPWWLRAGRAMLLVALLVDGAWRARGPLVGSIALLVFLPLFGASALAPRQVQRWERRHPMLDGSLAVPMMFLALAVVIRPLSLRVCLLVALLTGVVMVPVAVCRSRRAQRPQRDEPEGGS